MSQIKVYSVQVNQGEGIGLETIVGSPENAINYIDSIIEHDYKDDGIIVLNEPDNYIYDIVYELDGEFLFGVQEHVVDMEL